MPVHAGAMGESDPFPDLFERQANPAGPLVVDQKRQYVELPLPYTGKSMNLVAHVVEVTRRTPFVQEHSAKWP